MAPNRDFVSSTFKNTHLYANSATGDDSNSGLSAAKAKKTLTGVFNALPNHIQHNTSVHLDGTFTDSATVKCHVDNGQILVIDGGDGVTADPTYGGPHTVTSSDSAWIEVSGAGWPVDAMKGMWLQDANDTSKLWLIFKNTAERIYPCKYFGTPPTSVKVVIPTTTINSSLQVNGCTGRGEVWLQRTSMTGSGYFYAWANSSLIRVSHLYSTTSNGVGFLMGNYASIDRLYRNTNTWALETTNEIGVTSQVMWFDNISRISGINVSVIDLVQIINSNLGSLTNCIRRGTRTNKLQFSGVKGNYDFDNTIPSQIVSSSGYQPTEISGSSDIGISLLNSHLVIGANVYIQNNTNHGIEADRSQIVMTGSVKGSGNGGAGVYAHNGSSITIKDGAPPTLTGTVGDVAVLNPNYEDTTWSAIDGGDGFSSAEEATTIKEVA